MRIQATVAGMILLALPLQTQAEFPSDPAHGLWLTENHRAIVELAPCGVRTCGRTVWVANPVDDSGSPKRDEMNADQAKRARPICGIELVGDLKKSGDGTWSEGWLYNPRDGARYSAEVRALSPSELEVRGYVGVSLLGRSQVWTRVEDDRGGCTQSS